jgi:hypothetical protein
VAKRSSERSLRLRILGLLVYKEGSSVRAARSNFSDVRGDLETAEPYKTREVCDKVSATSPLAGVLKIYTVIAVASYS